MAEGLRRNLSEQETNPDQSLNTDNDIELTDALLRRLGSIYEDMSRISKPLGEINNIHEGMRELIIRLGIMRESMRELIIRLGIMRESMPELSQQERIISEIISEFAKMHEDMSSRLQESESIYKEMYNNMSKLLGKGKENNQDDQ